MREYLKAQVFQVKQARTRQAHTFGRLWNRLAGANPDYIELSAPHLQQTLQLLARKVETKLHDDQTYLLRYDVARSALDRLSES